MAPCVSFLLAVFLAADPDAARVRPTGTWKHSIGANEVVFHFEASSFHCSLETEASATLEIDADYGVTRDGVLFGIITKVKANGVADEPVAGDLFRFRFKIDGETLTISDLKSPNGEEAARLIEGKYHRPPK